MFPWISCLLILNIAVAEVGKVNSIAGTNTAFILRNSNKINAVNDFPLEIGDEIHSSDSVVQIYIYPSTQISLSKNTQIKITDSLIEETDEKERAFSVIEFLKGAVRILVTKEADQEIDQRVKAVSVAFAVRGTEFEVSNENDDIDLDVIEGEVEASSPDIQTFVPEIIKAQEGFRYSRKAKRFERRKVRLKFKDRPAFLKPEEIKERRKQLRLKRKEVRTGSRNGLSSRIKRRNKR